jgi:hypothetical protein
LHSVNLPFSCVPKDKKCFPERGGGCNWNVFLGPGSQLQGNAEVGWSCRWEMFRWGKVKREESNGQGEGTLISDGGSQRKKGSWLMTEYKTECISRPYWRRCPWNAWRGQVVIQRWSQLCG